MNDTQLRETAITLEVDSLPDCEVQGAAPSFSMCKRDASLSQHMLMSC